MSATTWVTVDFNEERNMHAPGDVWKVLGNVGILCCMESANSNDNALNSSVQ